MVQESDRSNGERCKMRLCRAGDAVRGVGGWCSGEVVRVTYIHLLHIHGSCRAREFNIDLNMANARRGSWGNSKPKTSFLIIRTIQ